MRLNQRQIEVFNAVMMNQSVTAAASILRTSQPTISRELRELEKYLGFELFHRFGKRLTPTDQGQRLHAVVRRSYIGMDDISRAAVAIGGHKGESLRIACIPAFAEAILPMVMPQFMKERTNVNVSIHSLEEVSLKHDLTAFMFDVGLTEGSYHHDGVANESIDVGEVVCVLPTGHPLTAKAVLEPHDFENTAFVYFSRSDPYRRKLDDIFEAACVTRSFTVETTTAASVCSMVASGVGVSIVNPLTAALYARMDVVLRRFSMPVPYQLNLWRQTKGSSAKLNEEFAVSLREVAKTMHDTMVHALENPFKR